MQNSWKVVEKNCTFVKEEEKWMAVHLSFQRRNAESMLDNVHKTTFICAREIMSSTRKPIIKYTDTIISQRFSSRTFDHNTVSIKRKCQRHYYKSKDLYHKWLSKYRINLWDFLFLGTKNVIKIIIILNWIFICLLFFNFYNLIWMLLKNFKARVFQFNLQAKVKFHFKEFLFFFYICFIKNWDFHLNFFLNG